MWIFCIFPTVHGSNSCTKVQFCNSHILWCNVIKIFQLDNKAWNMTKLSKILCLSHYFAYILCYVCWKNDLWNILPNLSEYEYNNTSIWLKLYEEQSVTFYNVIWIHQIYFHTQFKIVISESFITCFVCHSKTVNRLDAYT